LATPSATRQSPVGSAAKACPVKAGVKKPDTRQVAKNNPEYDIVRMMFRGQCNMI
jgi:hypothetical protein